MNLNLVLLDVCRWLWALEDVLEAPPDIYESDISGRSEFLHLWHQSLIEDLARDLAD